MIPGSGLARAGMCASLLDGLPRRVEWSGTHPLNVPLGIVAKRGGNQPLQLLGMKQPTQCGAVTLPQISQRGHHPSIHKCNAGRG